MKIFSIKTAILLLLVGATVASCNRKVTRVDIDEQIDLSGKWNDTDSKLTSEKLTMQMTTEQWLADFLVANEGNKPVMIVGFIKNRQPTSNGNAGHLSNSI